MLSDGIREKKKNYVIAGLLCLIFLSICLTNFYPLLNKNHYDDSYITYRYAVNLANGNGFVFNSYEKVNSASSFLYTLLLASIYKLGIYNMEIIASIIGLLSGTMLIFLLTLLTCSYVKNSFVAFVFLLPLTIAGSITGWTVSGMETIFFIALIVLFLYLYASDKIIASLFVLSLCLICRFEAVLLLFSVLTTELIVTNFRLSKRFYLFSIGILVFAGYLGFNHFYYGNLLPHALLFKKIVFYYSPGLLLKLAGTIKFFITNFFVISVMGGIWSVMVTAQILLLLLAKLRKNEDSRVVDKRLYALSGISEKQDSIKRVVVLLAIYIVISITSFIIGPRTDAYRYTFHLLPIFVLASVLLWNYLLNRLKLHDKKNMFALLIFLTLGVYQAMGNLKETVSFFISGRQHQSARIKIGHWIDTNISTDELIISDDIGAIAYYAIRHDFIDVSGLTTALPYFSAKQNKWENFTDWLQKIKPGYAAGTNSDQISSFKIIDYPHTYYYGITHQDEPYLNMNMRISKILKEIDTNYRKVKITIAKTDWSK